MSRDLHFMKLNPDSWMMSETVAGLDPLAELALFRLILIVWKKGSVPADAQMCLRLIGRPLPLEAVENALKTFIPCENEPERLTHLRTQSDRDEAMDALRKNQKFGALGGKKSAETRLTAKTSKTRTPARSTPAQPPLDHPLTHPQATLKTPSTKEKEKEKEKENNTPLTPKGGEGGETDSGKTISGEQLSTDEQIALSRKNYALREAKGLREEFLQSEAFLAGWVGWIEHLRAKAGGKNPPFTTVDAHKRQLNAYGLADALRAMDEAIRRGYAFPADPAKLAPAAAAAPLLDAAGLVTDADAYDFEPSLPPPEPAPRRASRPADAA